MTPEHKKSRQYAGNHINKPQRVWDSVLWSNGTKLELLGLIGQRYVCRRKNETYVEKNTLPTVRYDGDSVMLWGCFASSSTGNLQRLEGKMDSVQYQQILADNVMPSVRQLKLEGHWTFQLDSDPSYTS